MVVPSLSRISNRVDVNSSPSNVAVTWLDPVESGNPVIAKNPSCPGLPPSSTTLNEVKSRKLVPATNSEKSTPSVGAIIAVATRFQRPATGDSIVVRVPVPNAIEATPESFGFT